MKDFSFYFFIYINVIEKGNTSSIKVIIVSYISVDLCMYTERAQIVSLYNPKWVIAI